MDESNHLIGRVLRASTRGFAGALKLPEPEVPTFGMFCKTSAQQGQTEIVGLIYDIRVDDDLFARQVATADNLTPVDIADHQRNRQVPVEFDVLAVGHRNGGPPRTVTHALPPQPPMTLDPIRACSPADIRAFTTSHDFFRVVLSSVEVPADELLAAAIRAAADAQPTQDRTDYLREAGRELARLLARDLGRLENLLRRIRP